METESAKPIIVQSDSANRRNDFLPNGKSLTKIIFFALTIIIVGELIWAGFYLLKPNSGSKSALPVGVSYNLPSAKISLTSDTNLPSVSSIFGVNVGVSANSKLIGVDLIVKYDPNLVEPIVGNSAFTPGDMFVEYLGQSNDRKAGIFRISGISTTPVDLSGNEGDFGTIQFRAKAAGSTTLRVDYAQNNTTDSNVLDSKTGRDLLDRVGNLEVEVQ